MNGIPPEVEADGLRAYEQARAFEAVQQRRLPLIYGALTSLLAIGAVVMLKLGDVRFAVVCLIAAIIFPLITWRHWRRLKARHAANLNLLAELESRYGEQLPWIQVERHFAALAKLQAELREESGEPPG